MLFDSSFRKDLARAFGVTVVVLVTIVMTLVLIKTLGLAAGGRVAPQDVLLLMGFTGLGYLPIVLALALFIAVVACIGRLYRDSEMAVWMACGQPLRRFVAPVFRSVWPVLLLIALLQLFAWPWSHRESAQLRERYEKRGDLSRVAPGQFQSSRDGSKVFFIERDSERPGVGRNVFILTQQGRRESVTTAASGEVRWQDGDRYLLLSQGQRNEVDPARGAHALARFESYSVLADAGGARQLDELPIKALPSDELLSSTEPRQRAELVWRIGLVLGAANLCLLGVGLAASNPRRPNNWGLLLALLVFIVYFNLINLSQTWVARGRWSAPQALALLHGGAAGLGLALLLWRDEGLRLAARWTRRTRSAA